MDSISSSAAPGREIERKFLIAPADVPDRLDRYPHDSIQQGYLVIGATGEEVRSAAQRIALVSDRQERRRFAAIRVRDRVDTAAVPAALAGNRGSPRGEDPLSDPVRVRIDRAGYLRRGVGGTMCRRGRIRVGGGERGIRAPGVAGTRGDARRALQESQPRTARYAGDRRLMRCGRLPCRFLTVARDHGKRSRNRRPSRNADVAIRPDRTRSLPRFPGAAMPIAAQPLTRVLLYTCIVGTLIVALLAPACLGAEAASAPATAPAAPPSRRDRSVCGSRSKECWSIKSCGLRIR